jgi:MFS family permease
MTTWSEICINFQRHQLIFAIGTGCGCIFSGFSVNLVGRRGTIIIGDIIMIIVFLNYALILLFDSLENDRLYCVGISRVMNGFAVGVLYHTSILMNIELIPRSVSPQSAIFITFAFSAGRLLPELGMYIGNSLGLFSDSIVERQFWLLGPVVLHILRLCLILFSYKFDTPQYYMEKYGAAESVGRIRVDLKHFYKDIQ